MARKRGNKLLDPKRRSGYRLTPAQKAGIVQMYHMVGSAEKTARELGVHPNTVLRILQESNENPMLAAARAGALNEVAGKISGVTNQIIDSICPADMETHRHEVRDKDGNLLRVVREGPSLKDKAQSIAILTDRQQVLTNAMRDIRNPLQLDAEGAALSLPDSIDEARRLIVQKVKRLRIMDVEFDTGEVGRRMRQSLSRYNISNQEVADAEMELVPQGEPFD